VAGPGTERNRVADTANAVPAPAVLYAAKSDEDIHGSIPTQLEDGRALAEREGLDIVDRFFDEAASAYKGDRGPELERAVARTAQLATEFGESALVVQHSDRLARGDGRVAKHLVEYALWALKANVRILSVQDPQRFSDLLYAVVTGQRNHEASKRKGQATAAGHRRRFESGKRLGSRFRTATGSSP
jgi:DNA invertase Pin-like site-specific DNA recombinase